MITFHRHRFLSHHKAAVGISRAKLGLEGLAFHRVLRVAVLDALLLVNVEDGGQQRVVLAEHERVVKVFEHAPSHLLDFVAGVNHVHARFYAVFHFKR